MFNNSPTRWEKTRCIIFKSSNLIIIIRLEIPNHPIRLLQIDIIPVSIEHILDYLPQRLPVRTGQLDIGQCPALGLHSFNKIMQVIIQVHGSDSARLFGRHKLVFELTLVACICVEFIVVT